MNRSNVTGLDILQPEHPGFRTLVNFESWRVAAAVFNPVEKPGRPESLSRHLETDEVFVLLKGSCTLFIGGTEDIPTTVNIVEMDASCVYNIRKGTWHARTLTPETLVLIVENRLTGDFNSKSVAFPTD